jgi:energy-coupling factor transport system ATP-binding protein
LGHLWEQSTFNIPKSFETLLGLASILSLTPEVLIVDEPTGGLDLKVGRKVMETLKKINEEQGCTIIIITHDMALASKYAKRAIVLQGGNILIDGDTKDVFSQPDILEKAMLSPAQITLLGQKLSDRGYPPDILTVDEFIQTIS